MASREVHQGTGQPLTNNQSQETYTNPTFAQIDKSIILKAGKISLAEEFSIWIVDHQNFGSFCMGRVYIVAQLDNEEIFKSIGSNCTKCNNSVQLDGVTISRNELKRKMKEDDLRERIATYLEHARGVGW